MWKKIFFIATLILRTPVFSMEEESNLGHISHASSPYVAYGGEEGNHLFQEESKKVVALLKSMFSMYRTHPNMIKEDTLRTLINNISQRRRDIAMNGGSAGANEFGIFRLESDNEYSTTPLFLPQYTEMREHIRRKVYELIRQKKINQWIEEGSTRYRIELWKPEEWPICVSNEDWNFHQLLLKKPRVIDAKEKQKIYNALDVNFLHKFIERGNIVTFNGSPASFSQQLNSIVFDEQIKINQISVPNTLRWMGLAPALGIHQVKLVDTKKLRLIRVYIEHSLGGETYYPGYGFMGMVSDIDNLEVNTLTPPFMICHPGKAHLPPLVSCYENFLKNAILADSKNKDEVSDKIGLFQRMWTTALAYERGVGAVGEWIAEGLYQSHNCSVGCNESTILSIDNASYIYWSEDEFLGNYRKTVRVQPAPEEQQ